MLIRQKIILHLINQANRQVTGLQLVKWPFILSHICNLSQLGTFYQFLPYQHGPFSFNLYHEINNLVENGYLIGYSKHKIKLSNNVNIPQLNNELRYHIDIFVKKYSKLCNEDLLKYVYSNFPWFTINAVKPEDRLMKRPEAKTAIYTTGYQGLQIDGFLNLLLKNGIKQLLDVRNNPVSRNYGFHKSTLSSLCNKLHIRYKHLPELGIPSKLRSNLNSLSDYEKIFSKYEKEILSNNDSIDRITKLIESIPSVLVCSEEDPKFCHRTRLAKKVAKKTGLSIYDLRRRDVCNTSIKKQKFLLQ